MVRKVLLGAILTALLTGWPFTAQAAWTIDAKNRAVKDGTPVFLRIAYDQYYDSDILPDGHIATRNFENYGFNVYLHFMFGTQENGIKQLPALPSFMYGMATGNAVGGGSVEQNSADNGPFDLVANPNNFRGRFNAQPKAGGVYLADEVEVGLLSNIQTWAQTYKRDLPDQPRFVVLAPEGPLIPSDGQSGDHGYMEWVEGHANPYWWARQSAGGDWLAEDPYPVFKAETTEPGGYPHFWVADRTSHVVAAARQYGQVPITVLQLFKFTDAARFITPDEMWSHVVMAITEGARGLAWWEIGRGDGLRGQPDSVRVPADNALRDITLLLRDLEPVILSGPNPGLLVGNSTTNPNGPVAWRLSVLDAAAAAISEFNYQSGGRAVYVAERNALNASVTQWSPMLDQAGDVRTRVWEGADGNGYVFAYNYATTARSGVTLSWYKNLQAVEVLGEGRTITPNGASWTDDFGGSTSLNMNGNRIGHIYKLIPVGGQVPDPIVSFVNPPAGPVSGTVTVTVSATGGTPPYNYRVDANGTVIFTGTSNSFSWNTTTFPNGPTTLRATVTDANGHTGTATRSVTVSTGITASFTSPAPGATVGGTVSVGMAVSTATAPNTFQLSVDGTVVSTQTVNAASASYSWNTTGGPDGTHTLSLTVTDSVGHTGSASETVTVSNSQALTVTFTNPTQGQVVSGTRAMDIWVDGATGSSNTFVTKIDGVTFNTQTISGTHANIWPWDTTTLTDGTHTLMSTVTDSAGHTGTRSITVTVSNGAPLTATFTNPTQGQVVSGTRAMDVWVEGAVGSSNTFVTKIDGTVFNTQTIAGVHANIWPWDTTTLADGTHTLTATVTDSVGRTATTSITVTVSNGPPLAAFITNPTQGQVVSGTGAIDVWVENAIGASNTFVTSVDGTVINTQTITGVHANIWPWNTTTLSNGAHTVTSTVTDSVGRLATVSVTVTVSN